MTNKLSFYCLFLFFLVSSTSMAEMIKCPKLPLLTRINTQLSDGWAVVTQSNYFKKEKIERGKDYKVTSWLSHRVTNYANKNRTIIGCCSDLGDEVVCVRKDVEKSCELMKSEKNEKMFLCG